MKTETAGIVALHVSIKIDVEQLRDWEPERIAALFDGLAKAQAAVDGATNDPLLSQSIASKVNCGLRSARDVAAKYTAAFSKRAAIAMQMEGPDRETQRTGN